MNKQKAIDILIRYRNGRCTEAERQLVEEWMMYGVAEPFDLSDAQLLEDLLDIRLRLEHDLPGDKASTRKLTLRRWLPYAAAVLIFALSVGGYYYYVGERQQENNSASIIQDIAPGGNRASLTLPDGRTIDLSDEKDGIVIVGDQIRYVDGTVLMEKDPAKKENTGSPSPELVAISTPKGGKYQIILPDGSKVWLNSASTLRYPSQFNDEQREVELEGEAYFEVVPRLAKSPNVTADNRGGTPFHVKTKGQTVEVIGTQFNIAAYADEEETKTTLVEGSVAVKSAPDSQGNTVSKILSPNQQSTLRGNTLVVADVDASSFIAWKSGYFVFTGTELREAMQQLSRWYDVQVTYEGNIPKTPFYGKISRSNTLNEVLDIFKEGNVNFRIETNNSVNQLIVMP